jgi:signal transduction histidine kinase
MEKEQVPLESGFSLFDQEERVLQSAASMIGMLENVAGGVRELADAYAQSYREQRRLLRISDRLQLDLHQANHTLASQAEELKQLNAALQREIDLREALAEELRLLNENLEQRVKSEIAKGREQEHLLIQQSRHAVLGEMIGNITHQWRQPLFALSLIVQGIESEQGENSLDAQSLQGYLVSANRVIRQMNDTVDDFLNFFRPNKTICTFSLRGVVQNAWLLVQSSMNFRMQVVDDGAGELFASGFPNEFSQVLINIFANAKDAIRERNISPGLVEIRFGQNEENVWVDVRDNAGGIPEAALEKVFDAYFTTREKGTGIGLYMSRIIMRNMGGDIAACNAGNGAELRVILPKKNGAGSA